jgi:high-affinity nickel-transport protein
MWGIGHTLTIFVVGGAIILFKLAFTPRVGLSLEFTVAIMLVVLGTLNLFDVRLAPVRAADVRPLLVGIVHGLAGSAAATLLILPLIEDVRWALLYLAVFGIGTIVGMALMTIAIAAPAAFAAARVARLERWIRVGSGAVSLAFGAYLALRIGISDGLFGAHPQWTPE